MNQIALPEHYTDARRVEALYANGFDPEQIADLLEFPLSKVKNAIERAAQRGIDDARATVIREQELKKLDELERAHYQQATRMPEYDSEGKITSSPSLDSGRFVLQTMSARARLAGIEIKPDTNVNLTQVSLVGALSDMAKRNDKSKERIIEATATEVVADETVS